jgi:hypothetical protein
VGSLERYKEALKRIPPPGYGCHPTLLSVANYGVMAGLEGDRIFRDVRDCIPQGSRRVLDREITYAINKAMADHNSGTFTPRPRPAPVVHDGKSTLKKIISQGKFLDESDLFENSPIRLRDLPLTDAILLLETIFDKDALIWIGERYDPGIIGETIRTAAEWIIYFLKGGVTASHIILNPLTGTPAPTKTGDKETFRGDGNIAVYRYCLVEFDDLSKEDQIRFWSAVKLPITALIDSGGKSIHAWLDVQKLAAVETQGQWQSEIKTRLYDRILAPLGVDPACSNPARLSRLPGHFRTEKQAFQKILWMAPTGRPINDG